MHYASGQGGAISEFITDCIISLGMSQTGDNLEAYHQGFLPDHTHLRLRSKTHPQAVLLIPTPGAVSPIATVPQRHFTGSLSHSMIARSSRSLHLRIPLRHHFPTLR